MANSRSWPRSVHIRAAPRARLTFGMARDNVFAGKTFARELPFGRITKRQTEANRDNSGIRRSYVAGRIARFMHP